MQVESSGSKSNQIGFSSLFQNGTTRQSGLTNSSTSAQQRMPRHSATRSILLSSPFEANKPRRTDGSGLGETGDGQTAGDKAAAAVAAAVHVGHRRSSGGNLGPGLEIGRRSNSDVVIRIGNAEGPIKI